MSDMKIDEINKINRRNVDIYSIRNVLSASELTETQKVNYIRAKKTEIQSVLANKLSPEEYNFLMDNRSLVRFKPVKNLLTKQGDKILLAKSLDIPINKVDAFIQNVIEMMKKDTNNLFFNKNFSSIKTYIYRHGTQEQLLTTFNTELANSKNIVKTLTKELEVSNSSVAGYYECHAHKMTNKEMIRLYNVVDKNLVNAQKAGKISEVEADKFSGWALAKIYHIQCRSQMIRTIQKTDQRKVEL